MSMSNGSETNLSIAELKRILILISVKEKGSVGGKRQA